MTIDDSDDCAMDVPITAMPERCLQWPCVSFGDAARLQPVERYGHTYMCCPFCNGSYGEVKPMTNTEDLPALPQPRSISDAGTLDAEGWWTIDQMRAYAQAARAPLLAALSEKESELRRYRDNCLLLEERCQLHIRERDELRARLEAIYTQPTYMTSFDNQLCRDVNLIERPQRPTDAQPLAEQQPKE